MMMVDTTIVFGQIDRVGGQIHGIGGQINTGGGKLDRKGGGILRCGKQICREQHFALMWTKGTKQQSTAWCYIVLHDVALCYIMLHGVRWCYMVLDGVRWIHCSSLSENPRRREHGVTHPKCLQQVCYRKEQRLHLTRLITKMKGIVGLPGV